MPRGPRTELAGGIHHVWQRGNRRQTVFHEARDRRTFLGLLRRTTRDRGWHVLSYCLMENHFHLVVETPSANLGLGMRDLCSRYAQLFNQRHETGGGHLFQARFGSKLVATDQQFAQLLRYVAHNPVRAGLCSDPAKWPWSSHGTLLNGGTHPLVDVERVASLLAGITGTATHPYAALFDSAGPLRHLAPDLSPWKLRPTLAEILSATDLAAAVRRARRHGYRLADVAAHLGVSASTLRRRVNDERSVPF